MEQAKVLKALAAVMFLITAASFSVVADAEKREQTCVKKNFRTASKTTVTIGDVPNHEVSQEMSVADMEFSNPDFKVKDEWTYIHSDTIDGSGTHSGYFMDTHIDGSTDYGAFKGAVKTTVKADGSWEASWEGTYQYLGGSGKFKNLKGSGKYKGKASSTEPALEQCRETVEY
jgi:hypothetical protein